MAFFHFYDQSFLFFLVGWICSWDFCSLGHFLFAMVSSNEKGTILANSPEFCLKNYLFLTLGVFAFWFSPRKKENQISLLFGRKFGYFMGKTLNSAWRGGKRS